MADEGRLPRCKSESNLSDRILTRMQRSKSLNDVQYSAALNEQMREHLMRLQGDLKRERKRSVSLQRENVLDVMAARQEEVSDARATQEDLVLKMMQERDVEIKEFEYNARVNLHEEIDRVVKEKNEELRRAKREWEYEKEILLNSLNDQLRTEIRNECENEFERARKKVEMDYFNLMSEYKALQDEMKITKQAGREKADEIRRILQDQNKIIADIKKDASKDCRRQLAEMKEMQKIIDELEKKLGLESGSCLRLQMEKESLDEAFSRLKMADSWDKRISKSQIRGIGDFDYEVDGTAPLSLRLSSKPHNDPERVLHRKVIELSSLIRRLDENNQQIVARNQELIDEVENANNALEPLQQKTKRLGAKNMELVQTNRRQEERITLQQEDLISLKDKLKTYEDLIGKRDKELSKLKTKLKARIDVEAQKEQIETLQNAVQEQLHIINELRQHSIEKDRRLDVLRERIQRKQSRKSRKSNGRKSTSPDSLNGVFEDDSLCSEMSVASSRENSISPYNEAECSAEDRENYSRMQKEKLELERAYTLLQQQMSGGDDQPSDTVSSDLRINQARIKELEVQLDEALQNNKNRQNDDPFKEERSKLQTANKVFHDKLIETESELLSKTLEIKQLHQDLNDVEEQRDLLEFRIMELEHMTRPKSPDLESMLTDDDKINMSQDTEEVEGDAISVRIALKELEINKHTLLSPKEKSGLVQARNLIEKGEKEIQNLQSTEKRFTRRINELEGKYNNLKIKFAEKENEHASVLKQKSDEKKKGSDLTAVIFEAEENPFVDENKASLDMQDKENKLKEAHQRITELEVTNTLLQQTIQRYDNKMSTELSDNDIEILRAKVEELEAAKQRIAQLEGINSELGYRIQEYKDELTASRIIEDVVNADDIPESIALEIEDLKEENNNLSEELSVLRSRAQDKIFLTESVGRTVQREERQTQTLIEDETPWHKYMSPRSDRSLSRNENNLTPISLCDEGTQTPRIHEGEGQSERLVLEEHLQSAPVISPIDFEIDFSTMPVESEKMLNISSSSSSSTNYMDQTLDVSSAESLFRFADNLVKEATGQAKEALREELSLSFMSNSSYAKDDFSSPENLVGGREPGEMIDLCVNKLKNTAKSKSKDTGNISNYTSNGKIIDGHESFNVKMNGGVESLSGKTLTLDFDPLQIETSSVDENSYTNQPPSGDSPLNHNHYHYHVDSVQDGVLKLADLPDEKRNCNFDESSSQDQYYEESQTGDRTVSKRETFAVNGYQKSLPKSPNVVAAGHRLETSGSIASTDIEELLCYGAALREHHSGGYNITSSFEEERTLVDESMQESRNYKLENNREFDGKYSGYYGHFKEIPSISDEEGTPKSNIKIGNDLILPTFHFSAAENDGNHHDSTDGNQNSYQNQPEDSFSSTLEDLEPKYPETDSILYHRRKSQFGSFSLSCSENATGFDVKESQLRDRRQSQHFSDSLHVENINNRLRSRSLSPMRRSSLARPRSYSAGSDLLPFSQRLSSKRNSCQNQLSTSLNFEELSNDSLYRRKSLSKSFDSVWDDENPQESTKRNEKLSRKDGLPPLLYPKPAKAKIRSHSDNSGKTSVRSEADVAKKEINMLREECASLERQLKNKETIMKTMKAELKEEVENIALLEKKEKTIQEKAESNAYLTQELQRCQKDLDAKNSEIGRKDFEINALKTEVKNLEISKKHTEKSYSEVQIQVNKIEIAERKIVDIQEQHDVVLLKNRELIERIKHLEIAEKEFIELERNVIDLQDHLRGMEDIEAHRDELYGKFQNLKRQRDEFLKKGRMVEEERNDFMRTNQTMEQHLEEYKKKFSNIKKTNGELNRRILVLEREKKEVETRILDVQNDRNIMQTALGKLEIERDDLIREVKEVTSERIILEQKLAEMDDMLSDHDHLEEGFHSLRLKLAELTRQRDDAEMLIPSLKAKIALLKKACREKDETVTRYAQELKHVKYNITSSSLDEKSKIRKYETNQPSSRSKQKSSYFIETTERQTNHHSKPRRIEYEIQDDSVQLSDEDPSISEEGSLIIDRRNIIDTRAQTGRAIRVYEPRNRSSTLSRNYKAIIDYDPYKSSSSMHPERELKLKEGDYITVHGEMDVDGYLEAEVDGQTGLVPSVYVEEFEEENRNLSKANEIRTVRSGQRQRKFVTLYDYDPFTMARTGRPEQQLSLRKGDVVTVIGDVDIDGYYTAEINGRRGLIPSNFMRELGLSQTATSSSYGGQKSYETQSTRTVEQRNSTSNRNGTMEVIRDDVVGPPFPPSNLKIIRVVNKDSVLLTWKLPQMDKFGRSNGALVTGYKIWVNGRPKQEVKSHTMTKAIVSGINLRDKLDFDIQTVAENGFCSEKCHYNITGAYSLLNPIYEEFFAKAPGNYRTFVALYDYDPFKSSPNPNPSLELGFNEGDLVKVYDASRSDGFFQAEARGKKGLVPSNFLEEISVADSMYSRGGSESYTAGGEAAQSSRSYSHAAQHRTSTSEYEKRSSLSTGNGARRRKMVAVYDYDPLRQSPSKDKSTELNLRKGQYVTVIGDMRPDGFYVGEIDGRQGLVPGDFLESHKDDDGDSRRVQFASGEQVN